MKRVLVVSAGLVAAIVCSMNAQGPKRLLLVTTTSGFRHAAIPVQEQMIRQMAKASGEFTIVSTSDHPSFPTAEFAATVDARNARIPRQGAPDNRISEAQLLGRGGAAPAGRGGAAGGRGGGRGAAFPGQATGATQAQQDALAAFSDKLTPLSTQVNAARAALATASLAEPGPTVAADIKVKAEALSAAERALALARADALSQIQASPNRLTPAQVLALSGAAPAGRGGAAGAPGGGPSINDRVAAVLKEYLSPAALRNYDAVAFVSPTGELPLPDAEAFYRWVAEGHGFIGLHSATDTLHQSPEYIKMIGAEFAGHGAHSEVAVVNLDPASPLTAGWPNGVKITEEWYTFRNYDRSQVRALLAMETHPTNGTPGHFPVSWIKPYGKGRVFYSSLGHRDDVLDATADIGDQEFKVRYNPPATAEAVQKHLLTGIRWALGLVQADATVGAR